MNLERIDDSAYLSEAVNSDESFVSNALRVTKKVGGVIAEAYFAPKPWEKMEQFTDGLG